ncbi:hypothetical protein FRX31_023497, partial [Thalictrum thalictroides]
GLKRLKKVHEEERHRQSSLTDGCIVNPSDQNQNRSRSVGSKVGLVSARIDRVSGRSSTPIAIKLKSTDPNLVNKEDATRTKMREQYRKHSSQFDVRESAREHPSFDIGTKHLKVRDPSFPSGVEKAGSRRRLPQTDKNSGLIRALGMSSSA